MSAKLDSSKRQSDKPYASLLDIAKQHRTQTHLETGEISSKISREIIPGTTLTLKDDLSNESLSYEIEKQLGVGAFGVVYKGVDIRDPDKRELAIKIEPYATLRPCIEPLKDLGNSIRAIEGLVAIYAAGRVDKILYSNMPGVGQKLYLSRQAMSALRRFLQISTSLETEGEIFLGCLVMEYVNGRSLSSILEAARAQSAGQEDQILVNRLRLLQIMIDTSIAIGRLHKKGFVHCDLHPRNILATDVGVKIIDFTCLKHIGEHSGRISQNPYTPVSYASESDQENAQGIADYVDVYPLAAALYDALVDQPDFQQKFKVFYDENHNPIGKLPYVVKSYTKLNQISPSSLSNVIRRVLQKEHPELFAGQVGNAIQRADDLARALVEVFGQEFNTWLNKTDVEIRMRKEAANEQISALENELENNQGKNRAQWEDFSVWWSNEMEKELVRREQWAEDQLQWVQQEYYQESIRQESAKIRRTMFDVLTNEIKVSIDKWLSRIKLLESKRSKKLNEIQQTLDEYRTTHVRTVETQIKRVTDIEAERWRKWRSNPIRVIGENILFLYGIIATAYEVSINPFVRFFRETIGELRKVSWPTRQEAWRLTSIVLVSMTIVATMTGLIDLLMGFLWSMLLGK